MKHTTLILFAALLPLGAVAQSKLSPSLRAQLQAASGTMRQAPADRSYDAYLYITNPQTTDSLRQLGVRIGVQAGSVITAHIPATALDQVAALQGVRYIEGATRVRPMLDKARAASGTDEVQAGTGLPQPYTGNGVIVGVVDAGFDYVHPAFRSADGQTLRIARVWEQAYDKGTHPEGYAYGGELTTSEEILHAMGDVSTNSHGTHVAAIAAGRDCGNGWGGVAADANLVLVSKGGETPNNVNITEGVAYIFDYAKQQGKPCVVNLSLGTQTGPHDGSSAFDTALDALQGAGRIVVGSAGNFGASPIHVQTNGGQPVKTFIDFKQHLTASTAGGTIDVWGTKGGSYTVELALVNTLNGQVVSTSEVVDVSKAEGTSVTFTPTSSAKGSALITTEINPLNGKPHALITFDFTSKRANFEFALILTPADEATEVHAWADDAYVQFASNDVDGYVAGDTRYTLAEIGGTGKRIISVGAYTTRNDYTTAGSTTTEHLNETVGQWSSFSAAGPALDGRQKPDVSAPGCFIISAVSSNDANISSIPLAGSQHFEGHDYYWGYMQGTSMASPFVAGTVATWLQARPELTPEELRTVLDATAVSQAGDADRWGRGKLDAYNGLKYVLSSTGISTPVAAATIPFTWQRRADGTLSVLFADSSFAAPVELYDLSGRQVAAAYPAPGELEAVLTTQSLPAGIYLLHSAGHSAKVMW